MKLKFLNLIINREINTIKIFPKFFQFCLKINIIYYKLFKKSNNFLILNEFNSILNKILDY
jgi:hypothetical protein